MPTNEEQRRLAAVLAAVEAAWDVLGEGTTDYEALEVLNIAAAYLANTTGVSREDFFVGVNKGWKTAVALRREALEPAKPKEQN